MVSKKTLEYIERYKERKEKKRHRKRGKRKKTPEQMKAIRQKNMAKAMDIARKRSIAVRKEKAAQRRKEKELEKKKVQKLKEQEKRKAQRVKQRAIEKRRKEIHKKMAKIGNESYNKCLKPYMLKNRKHFYVYFSKNGIIDNKIGVVGRYASFDELNDAMKLLQKKNEMVVFPQKHILNGKTVTPVNYEYVVFRRKYADEDEEVQNAYLKNELGRFVEHKSENMPDDYYVFDKIPANIEETFWVYGYDSVSDRKTFEWIYENIFFNGFNDGYDMKRVYLFKNKIVLCNDNEDIDLIILKCLKDAVSFYNTMLKYINSGKFIFMGNIELGSKLKPWVEDKIIEKTGWPRDKVRRNTSGL
jgi:hypothetical protein